MLTREERSEVARQAAYRRWDRKHREQQETMNRMNEAREKNRLRGLKAAETRKRNRMAGEVTVSPDVLRKEKNRLRGLKARETYLRRQYSQNEITQWGVDGNGIRMQQTTAEERSESARKGLATRKELVVRTIDKNTFMIGDVTIRRNRKSGEWAVTLPVTFKGSFDTVLFNVVQALS